MRHVSRLIPRLGWIIALGIGVILPLLVSDFDLLDLSRVLTLAMAVAGLNLLVGHSGQVSVGHGAIFGLGGYAAMIPVVSFGWPWWAGVLLAAVLSLAFGILLGIPALKMGGANLGLLTIAVAVVFPLLLIRFQPLTGGTFGMFLPSPAISLPDSGFTSRQLEFWVCLLALAVVFVALRNLVHGRLGRALAAVRTSSLLAAANGIAVNRVKLIAFAVSSTVAGVAGALYALVVSIAVPDSYVFTFSIALLAASVIGGSRSWAGAIIGAAIIVYLPTLAEAFVGGQAAGNWSQFVYAAGLALCLIVAPSGIAGAVTSLLGRAFAYAPMKRAVVERSTDMRTTSTAP